MDRISTASKAADLFGAGKHGFKDGNLSLGITPTDFNAQWFNGVQEELLNVIEAAGIVPSAANRNQLLTALRGASLFQTPAQFSSDVRVATTAFVQKALGNLQVATSVVQSGNFLASDAGGAFLLATAGTFGLPLLSSVPLGATFTFMATVDGVVVSRQGADMLSIGSAAANTLSLQNGDTAVFVKFGAFWALMSGSAANRNSQGDFGRSLTSNGYQKLPSGLIIQWGATMVSSSSDTTVTLPITFPNGIFGIFPAYGHNAGAAVEGYLTANKVGGPANVSQIIIRGSTASGNSAYWFAIGY